MSDLSTRASILIRNGYVVPGAHQSHLDRADILIEGNRIAAIGTDLRPYDPSRAPSARDRRQQTHRDPRLHQRPHPFQRKLLPGLLGCPAARSLDPPRISAVRAQAAAGAHALSAHHAAGDGVPALRHHHGAGRSHQPPRGTGRLRRLPPAAYRDIGLRAAITTSMSDRPFLAPLPWVDELMDPAIKAELATLPVPSTKDQLAMFARNSGTLARRRQRTHPRHSRAGRPAMVLGRAAAGGDPDFARARAPGAYPHAGIEASGGAGAADVWPAVVEHLDGARRAHAALHRSTTRSG